MPSIVSFLFQVGADDIEQLLGGLCVEHPGVFVRVNQVRTNVVLGDFGHQPGHSAPNACDQVHNLLATRLALQCPLDRLDLALHATHARQQLLLFSNGPGHACHIA
jgi:hypothetical protein